MPHLKTILLHGIPGALCLGFLLPLFFIFREAGFSGRAALHTEAWPMVQGLTLTTLHVSCVAVTVALILGGGAAWAVNGWNFAGRRVVSVLLCLPFALPPYLLAGIYREVQRREMLPLPEFENPFGAGLLLGLALYPWVYLPLKAQLAMQSGHYGELGQSLGLSRWQRFLRIHLGLLLPTLGITALLVLMDVVSDFGTVSMLGVKTLSVGIHDAMFDMYRRDWAAQLSVFGLALPVMAVLLFGLWGRRRGVYQPTNRNRPQPPRMASPAQQAVLLAGLGLLLTTAFFFPVGMLIHWARVYMAKISLNELPEQVGNTLWVTLLVSALTLLIAVGLNLLLRLRRDLRVWRGITIWINLNYALPSVMLAIAVLFLSTGLPEGMTDLLLSESIGLLVLAGCLGYLCFPWFSMRSGLEALSPRLDDLCTTLNVKAMEKTFKIYLPLLRRSVACGCLLVLVNMAKELPLSQILQPFGFQSLSMRLYSFAGMGLLEESALYALCLIALALYPVVALDRLITGRREASC
ncbi:MAG: hypothetical protein AAF492_05135 [Verrucomicrobiota bacterium]